MKRTITLMAVLSLGVSSGANAQSLLDNLRGLKETVKTLTGAATSISDKGESYTSRVDGTRRYDVASFDVAGLKLNMTPREVRRIFEARGFSISEKNIPPHLTFAGLAKREAERLHQTAPPLAAHSGLAEIVGSDPNRNQLRASFISTSAGPVVSEIRLTFDKDTNDMSLLEADVFSRYGVPSLKMLGAYGSHWCDHMGKAKCDLIKDPTAPQLEFATNLQTTLTLTNWQAMKAERDAEIAALFAKPSSDRQRSLLGT